VRVAVWRPGDGGEEVAVEALGAGDAWVWREEKEGGRGEVEDGEAGAALTRAREAVGRSNDDGKAVAAEELGGGGSRAQRGEEERGDECGEGQVRASAFYRGRWRWRHQGLNGRC
jgi:hypothetical protein